MELSPLALGLGRIRPNSFVGVKLAGEMKACLLELTQTVSLASAGFATLFIAKPQSRGWR